jgi:hypothetical protein
VQSDALESMGSHHAYVGDGLRARVVVKRLRIIRRRSCYTGGAKGTRNPSLTRQNSGSAAVSLRLVPIRSRSLPAVSFSGLDGVKSGRGTEFRASQSAASSRLPAMRSTKVRPLPSPVVVMRSPGLRPTGNHIGEEPRPNRLMDAMLFAVVKRGVFEAWLHRGR